MTTFGFYVHASLYKRLNAKHMRGRGRKREGKGGEGRDRETEIRDRETKLDRQVIRPYCRLTE